MALYKSLFILAVLSFSAVHAETIDLASGAKVEFEAVGKPSLMTMNGSGAKAKGQLVTVGKDIKGELVLDLNAFTTEMDTRDEHMKEKYLETSKSGFDKAILKINQADLDTVFPTQDGDWNPKNIKASLTLHGVTKEINLDCKMALKEQTLKGNVSFNIKLSDFAIEIPSFAGITVADNVTIKATINNKVTK